MKKILTKNIFIYTLFIVFVYASPLSAQEQITTFLEGTASDSEKLMKGYFDPFMKSFGAGVNNGWYNTGKPHKLFGFDITATVSAVFIPDAEKFYTLPEGLEATSVTGSNDQLPTVFGPTDITKRPVMRFEDDEGLEFLRISAPPGLDMESHIGVNAVPVPMVQAGLGIFKKTDLKVRFIPAIDYGDGEFELLGFGILHSIKQWIPGIKEAPFDLSLFAGYTTMKNVYTFSSNTVDPNAQSVLEITSLTAQGVLSKKIGVLTLYGGLGYATTTLTSKLTGGFELERGSIVQDPFDLEFSTSGIKANGGFRLKLAIITIHAEYALQEYSAITAGIGFTVR